MAHDVEKAERRAAVEIAQSAGGFAPARPSREEMRASKTLSTAPSPTAHLRKAAGPARFVLSARQDESAAAAPADGANEQEATPGARPPVTPEEALARAEQLADARDWSGALALFSQVAIPPGAGPLAERALFGRARCRLALGQTAAARTDLTAYLGRFPHGRFADQARALLR